MRRFETSLLNLDLFPGRSSWVDPVLGPHRAPLSVVGQCCARIADLYRL